MRRGFADDVWFNAVGPKWVPRTVATRANVVLLEVDWSAIEPRVIVDEFSMMDRNQRSL